MTQPDYDFAVIGGGFYGCCVALLLRSISDRVVLIESGDTILDRASRVNQARIHTGFHYPRSFLTSMRSMALHRRFATDFPDAVVDNFDMLYAIANRRSKISANRFLRMYQNLGAPIAPANRKTTALFSPNLIESVFNAREWAFDYRMLKDHLWKRIDQHGIELRLDTTVNSIEPGDGYTRLDLSTGPGVTAGTAFNVTYAMINGILSVSGLTTLPFKHEMVELALVEPPPELNGLGVTVMDGPFFSIMPYPSENLYSLTHVRYTPHLSWVDGATGPPAYEMAAAMPKLSRWRHMVMDSQRYMPSLADASWQKSLFDVKTVLVKNERNDGRPILFHKHIDAPNLISIMGSKIDNIYDLFDILPRSNPEWRDINLSCLL